MKNIDARFLLLLQKGPLNKSAIPRRISLKKGELKKLLKRNKKQGFITSRINLRTANRGTKPEVIATTRAGSKACNAYYN